MTRQTTMRTNALTALLVLASSYMPTIKGHLDALDSPIEELSTTTDISFAEEEDGVTATNIPDQFPNEFKVIDHDVTEPETTHQSIQFPNNHKNYTPYVSSIELPPLLNQFNAYQEQYKTYYKQKSEYAQSNRKPVKFEDGGKNKYAGLGSYLETNDGEDEDRRHRLEELQHGREPFPYTYDSERLPLATPTSWEEQLPPFNTGYYPSKGYGKPEVVHPDKGLKAWKKALKFFTALVPIGLLLATFTPSVISINTTADQKPTRQRSLDSGSDPECERRALCELSRDGKAGNGSYVEKSLWYLANETPDDIAQQFGVKDLFQAIRADTCEMYKCRHQMGKAIGKRVGKASWKISPIKSSSENNAKAQSLQT